jgi:hypothetical protein
MKAMRGPHRIPKALRAKSKNTIATFREAFGVRTRPRVALPVIFKVGNL